MIEKLVVGYRLVHTTRYLNYLDSESMHYEFDTNVLWQGENLPDQELLDSAEQQAVSSPPPHSTRGKKLVSELLILQEERKIRLGKRAINLGYREINSVEIRR